MPKSKVSLDGITLDQQKRRRAVERMRTKSKKAVSDKIKNENAQNRRDDDSSHRRFLGKRQKLAGYCVEREKYHLLARRGKGETKQAER